MNIVMTTPFINGDYTVVVMGKSDFFNNIQSLKNFKSSQLTIDKDYLLKRVEIQNGIIKSITFDNAPHFDDSNFYYTDNKESTFYYNKATGIIGSFFALNCHIEFLSQYKSKVSNIKLIIEIPDNSHYMDGSLIIDKKVSSYTQNENQMIIPVNKDANCIRLCIIPTKEGSYSTNSFIEFEIDGQTIVQPLKNAAFDATEMEIFVLDKTGNKSVDAFGIAQLGSQVFLYDNEVLVGQTKSDNTGEWIINFDLINPSKYSTHRIYAIIIVQTGIQIKSEVKTLVYNCNYLDVVQITLLNNNRKTVSNYPYQKNEAFYIYANKKCDLVFMIEFNKNDTEIIKNVSLITSSASNNQISKPATYDPITGKWIVEGYYEIDDFPVGFFVKYDCDCNLTLPAIDEEYDFSFSEEDIKNYEEGLRSLGYDYELIEKKYSTETKNAKLIYKISAIDSSNQAQYGYSKIIKDTITEEEIEIIDQNPDFNLFLDENGNKFYMKYAVGEAYDEQLIDVKRKIIITTYFDLLQFDLIFDIDNITIDDDNNSTRTIQSSKSILRKLNKYDWEIAKIYINKWDKFTEKVTRHFSFKYNDLLLDSVKLVDTVVRAKDLFSLIQYNKQCMPFKNKVSAYAHTGAYLTISAARFWNTATSKIFGVNKYKDYLGGKALDYLSSDTYISAAKEIFDNDCYAQNYQRIKKLKPIMDPSGYVYEAVESNRVEGVTTTIFEKVKQVDIYGDEIEVIEFWNAQLYCQENPLITNNIGWYAWDVPEGLWQVKYEKDDYEIAYSEWLPVPPPQLDVNVPIVSLTNPKVFRVTCYESRIEIEFTKYMNIDKLTDENIIIKLNEDVINGNIEFVNSEKDPNKNGVNYTSIIYFIPSNKFEVGNNVNVLIKKSVTSYSDVSMKNDYNDFVEVIKEPTINLDSEKSNVVYGETNEINIAVTLSPIESIRNKKLLIETNSSGNIQIVLDSIELSDNEIVQIPLKILLPGIAYVTISLEGTGIKIIKTININLRKTKLDPVKASVESNTTIDANSYVDLYSNLKTSQIIYTTDDTIDSSNFKIYNGSIIIKKDTKLNAIARNDGYEDSDPVTYFYAIPKIIYIVSFDSNGGTIETLNKEVKNDEKYGELPLPTKDNYNFGGWYLESTFETIITPDTIVDITSNITLYARWMDIIDTEVMDTVITDTEVMDTVITDTEVTDAEITNTKVANTEVIDTDITNVKITNTEIIKIPTETSLTSTNEPNSKPKNKNNKGMIIGITIGCIAVVVIVVIAIVIIVKKRNKNRIFGKSEEEVLDFTI